MDGGAWQAIVHGVTKSWTQLSDQHYHFFHYFLRFFPSDFVECPSLDIFQERLINVKYTVISQEKQLEYSTRQ